LGILPNTIAVKKILTLSFCWSNLPIIKELNLSLQTLSCGKNQLTALDVSNQHDLRRLFCGNNLLTSLDIYHNSNLGVGWEDYYNLELDSMPGLQKVCVWTMPFPPDGLKALSCTLI
jgi:hypothetical protein